MLSLCPGGFVRLGLGSGGARGLRLGSALGFVARFGMSWVQSGFEFVRLGCVGGWYGLTLYS